jgi:hypothetical protein
MSINKVWIAVLPTPTHSKRLLGAFSMKLLPTAQVPPGHPFLTNKYTATYFSIIHNAAQQSSRSRYLEKHHIIPVCMFVNNRSKGVNPGFISGNPNRKDNLVSLTLREHFICHWLLTKMVVGH